MNHLGYVCSMLLGVQSCHTLPEKKERVHFSMLFSVSTTMMTMFIVSFVFPHQIHAQFAWKNCGSQSDDIQLNHLNIDPHPIIAPGTVAISITIEIKQNLSHPLKVCISLSLCVDSTIIPFLARPLFP